VSHLWTRRSITALAVALLAVVAAGCSIQTDSAPRDIPEDQRGRLASGQPSPDEATGEGRIYLLGPDPSGRPLRSVLRDNGGRLEGLVTALIEGPNAGEVDQGLRSALSSDIDVLSVDLDDGVVDIDLSSELLDTPAADLQLAVAQIVLTATELRGDRSVIIRVNGKAESWPNGAGQDQSTPLTIFDFPDYAQTSQPPFPMPPPQAATTTTAVPVPTTGVAPPTVAVDLS
jgi:spore germination protein GerM